MGAKQVITSLEVLFTANTDAVDQAGKRVKDAADKIEKRPVKATVSGDAKGALDSMERVEKAGKKIVTTKTMATVDANIERAEKNLGKTKERLDYLRSVETDLEVDADIKRAEAAVQRIERQRDALVSAKEKMIVDADTDGAEKKVGRLFGRVAVGGKEAGEKGGRGLAAGLDSATRGAGEKVGQVVGGDIGSTLESALTAIPVAGGIILAASAIGKAIIGGIQDGLNIEVGRDRLQALTGIDEPSARKIAAAAGSAYAATYGESIEANMDTARLALQFDLIDPRGAERDSARVISSLAGIADVLGEDVRPVAQATMTMLKSGLAKSADEAFDVIAAGARNGVNSAEDLLDTMNEYSALFVRLGLSGPQSLGLVNQALKAGARNSDFAADAIKEFQIRATDASVASAAGFEALGLSAEEMTAQIAAGGDGAAQGLDTVLDRLREMEDPVARNAAAVALFGTKAEDLGDALFAMDLSTAVDGLGQVEGAARRMFDTLNDNDASRMESAQRNIEVAVDGMKGALAGAFSEPLADFAEWVSTNRGPVLQFFQDLVNGAINFAQAANTGVGDFVSGPLAAMVEGIATAVDYINGLLEGRPKELDDLADSMRGFADNTQAGNDKLEAMRGKFNTFADAEVQLGYLNDAALRAATAVGEVGLAADGSVLDVTGLSMANLGASAAGAALEVQLRKAIGALDEEARSASAAGEGQAELAERYARGEDALMEQLRAMNLTDAQARLLIDTYAKVPGAKSTEFSTPGITAARELVDAFRDRLALVPAAKRTEIEALVNAGDLAEAERQLNYAARDRDVKLRVSTSNRSSAVLGRTYANAAGGLYEFMAGGGLTPLSPGAQMVPPDTWRVVGDRKDVAELYAPLDGSARSWALLLEGFRRMPGSPPERMAGGGATAGSPHRALAGGAPVEIHTHNVDPHATAIAVAQELARVL